MNYQLMTARAFMLSYDRDVLDLQDDPARYISEVEAEVERRYPKATGFDAKGNKVWPVAVLKEAMDIRSEGPLWPEEPSPAAT